MLEVLFGNKNIERILVFLFVNEKCYGTQLHRLIKTPLTPIQKALLRLEKGEVITSYLEGKTRYYQFNPAYPLLPELQSLLKKTYTLLTASERRTYYVLKKDSSIRQINQENKTQVLLAFWEKLSDVNQLTFNAQSKESSGWNGKGRGEVKLTKEGHHILIFNEKGSWQDKHGGEMDFTNTFRWTLDRHNGVISLEHLRRGPNYPVFLFHLAPSTKHSLSSVDSHQCDSDTYFGQIHFDRFALRLNWRVIGPKKNEEIDYYYF
jgi:hypothetical protein